MFFHILQQYLRRVPDQQQHPGRVFPVIREQPPLELGRQRIVVDQQHVHVFGIHVQVLDPGGHVDDWNNDVVTPCGGLGINADDQHIIGSPILLFSESGKNREQAKNKKQSALYRAKQTDPRPIYHNKLYTNLLTFNFIVRTQYGIQI